MTVDTLEQTSAIELVERRDTALAHHDVVVSAHEVFEYATRLDNIVDKLAHISTLGLAELRSAAYAIVAEEDPNTNEALHSILRSLYAPSAGKTVTMRLLDGGKGDGYGR